MDVLRIVVPGVPRALERNRHRIVKPKAGAAFVANYLPAASRAEQGAIRLFAQNAMQGAPPMDCAIDMRVAAYMPVPASWSKKKREAALSGQIHPTGKPDADNLLKQYGDGLREIVFRDDAQVTDCVVWKRYSDTPRVVVEIRPAKVTATIV